MLINLKQLIGLPVITRSQQPVGKIIGLILNNESHAVQQYVVKATGLAHLFTHELLVSPEQVISLDANKIVIEDLTETALATMNNAPAATGNFNV